MERLKKGPEHSGKKGAYAKVEQAGLTDRMTAQELLLAAIFGNAPSIEELRARTPEDIVRIREKEEQEAETHRREIAQALGALPETPTRELLTRQISRVLSGLTERERTVLRLRFGLVEDGKPRTLKEVGDVIGKSPSTAHRVERKALGKLRKP